MRKKWLYLLILIVVVLLSFFAYNYISTQNQKKDRIETNGTGVDADYLKKEVGKFFGIENI